MVAASNLALALAIDNDAPMPAADDNRENLRMAEALLFASAEPLSAEELASRLPQGAEVPALLREIQAQYAGRGVNLVQVGGKWAFRTAADLAFILSRESVEPRKLSRAALETLSIIAYHQPVTRAEIEAIRGVTTATGTLDVLLATGWVRMRGRRRVPGRPITYGTSEAFLSHFGLDTLADLPGVDELRAAGLLDNRAPADLNVPEPRADGTLAVDEDPLEEGGLPADLTNR